MLPNLTSLQYLVLHLLFVGPQTGGQLRETLRSLGVRQSRTAFSRMMMRLVVANYANPEVCTHQANGQTVRETRFEITDLGVFDWLVARKFYLNLAPPSLDLVPLVTESGQLAAYDPALRKKVSGRRTAREIQRALFAITSQVLGKPLDL